jgi:hypothetical protein
MDGTIGQVNAARVLQHERSLHQWCDDVPQQHEMVRTPMDASCSRCPPIVAQSEGRGPLSRVDGDERVQRDENRHTSAVAEWVLMQCFVV